MTNILNFKLRSPNELADDSANKKFARRQFEFDFNRERLLIVVVAEGLHGATFLRSLTEARPSEIIDLRDAPHFHFTAIAPELLLRSMHGLKIRYRHIGVSNFPTSVTSIDSLDLPSTLAPVIANHSFNEGPLCILVSNVDAYRRVEPGLLTALHRIDDGPWTISVVG